MGFSGLFKPQYLLQPRQLLRRVQWQFGLRPPRHKSVLTPWKLPLIIDTEEAIGQSIWLQGVYDLLVTEVLWRLTQPGDCAIDVGANFGYTASIFSARAGRHGCVYAFEPHPVVYDLLRENTAAWKNIPEVATVSISPIAVSDRDGDASLHVPPDFKSNRGLSSMQQDRGLGADAVTVKVSRLENVIPRAIGVAVMKVDVEGHELSVFAGMGALLHSKFVRNIVFEEEHPYPAQTHKFLEDAGYTIFGLHSTFRGIRLVAPDSPNRVVNFAPNFIATLDQGRIVSIFSHYGWKCLAA